MAISLVEVGNNCILLSLPFSCLVACLDGALHVWKANSNFVRPDMTIEGAHTKGTEVGSMTFSVDGRTMMTRGGDETVKCMWSPIFLILI
jgi:WD40 repeat protein